MVKSSLGKKVLGAALSAGMVLTVMGAAVPQIAMADESPTALTQSTADARLNPADFPTFASFALTTHDLDMSVGQQVDMETLIDKSSIKVVPADYKYHFDYLVDASYEGGTNVVSVNKHTGELNALAQGTARVGVCMVSGDRPASGTGGQIPGQPDGEVIMVNYVYVTVGAAQEYGFQGDTNAVKMIEPKVTTWSGNMDDGYVNVIDSMKANEDGTYSFKYETTAGFVDHNTPDAYADWNAGNIVLLNDEGSQVGALSAENDGALTVAATSNTDKQITLTVDPSVIEEPSGSGQYHLAFQKGLRGNNKNRVLGTTVTFDFTIE